MNLFNNFIDSLKASYISVKDNQNTVLKSGLALFVVNCIIALVFIILGAILLVFTISGIVATAEMLESGDASVITNIFLFLLILFAVMIMMLVMAPLKIITTSYGAIVIHEGGEFQTKDLMAYIKTNYLKILWGNFLIGIVLMVCLSILYVVGLIIIIPLAVLTSGIGAIILFSYISAMYSYWSLFTIKDGLSPFAALDKNINLGFNKTAIITGFQLVLISLSIASSAILGIFSILVALIVSIFGSIITQLFVLKTLEIKE